MGDLIGPAISSWRLMELTDRNVAKSQKDTGVGRGQRQRLLCVLMELFRV
jgi:hypothetical protein